ncbi:MAG: efflux transporter outer membrane subunit [Desulfonatronovibrio sp.]
MNFKTAFFLLTVFFMLPGCSVHEPYEPKVPENMPEFFAAEHGLHAPDWGKWWQQFDDPVLDRLMDKTFERNPDIKQAFARVQQMRAAAAIAGAGRYPHLELEGSAGRQRSQGVMGPVEEDRFNLSASAVFEIDVWRKLKMAHDAAGLELLASREDLRALYLTLGAGLAENYYLAVEQKSQAELARKNIQTFKHILELVELRYARGLVSSEDIYQTSQNLASARSSLPLYQAGAAQALNQISIITGEFPDSDAMPGSKALPEIPEKVYAGLPSDLLKNRPDLQAALLRLKSADLEVGQALADRFPSFRLAGDYGGASEELRNILDSPNIFWNLLVQIAMPVLDGGQRAARVDARRSVFEQNLWAYHQAVLQACKEVEDALILIQEKSRAIEHIKAGEKAASRALELSMDNYVQGVSDLIRVFEAQRSLHDSRSSLLTQRRELVSAYIQLTRALGGEWMDEYIKSHADKHAEYKP